MVLDDHRHDSFAAHPEAGPKVLGQPGRVRSGEGAMEFGRFGLFAMQIYGEPLLIRELVFVSLGLG